MRNNDAPFFHETHVEQFRTELMKRQPTNTPASIQYTYRKAFRFDGLRVENGEPVEFRNDNIDAQVAIISDYGGILTTLPPTGRTVYGILHTNPVTEGHGITSWICPSYFEIQPDQLQDLIACYRSGQCRSDP